MKNESVTRASWPSTLCANLPRHAKLWTITRLPPQSSLPSTPPAMALCSAVKVCMMKVPTLRRILTPRLEQTARRSYPHSKSLSTRSLLLACVFLHPVLRRFVRLALPVAAPSSRRPGFVQINVSLCM
ncbi:hypothetical protein B0H14DRAFT_3859997 [Mycena olivaceomarginata]|nr:hypothetical protein B0H14DRAFT_3859997 [Mycena olivaceomarginata]